MKALTLAELRSYAVSRSLFKPTTLPGAINKLGFVQADPIRAPARAQDLILRHRVKDYRAGDLERRYARLAIEEDALVNYGFLPRQHLALMHPRVARRVWDAQSTKRAEAVLAFVRECGEALPREVQLEFDHGRTRNAWGGSSNAVTELLDGMHYRGLLRVVRREGGFRVYAPADHGEDPRSPQEKANALLALTLEKYAPVTSRGLGVLCSFLRYGAPHLTLELKRALAHAKETLPSAEIDGQRWFWPEGESPASKRWKIDEEVRLLAPFDPIVWDRQRFELFWGWAYRFEAYTPAPKRKLGYYALPLLWRGQVIGWGNLAATDGRLSAELGYLTESAPREAAYKHALQAELARMATFLAVTPPGLGELRLR